jgi:hypothetical protein
MCSSPIGARFWRRSTSGGNPCDPAQSLVKTPDVTREALLVMGGKAEKPQGEENQALQN